MANVFRVTQAGSEFGDAGTNQLRATQIGAEFGDSGTNRLRVTLMGVEVGIPYAGTPVPPTLTCPPGAATIGLPYAGTLVVTGGTPPLFTFSITVGSLPPGLTLNTGSGVISGIPTAAGTYAYTAHVDDGHGGTANSSCSINVGAAGVLLYVLNYRELDTASQIATALPIHTSYTGRLIATDHTRKWTRWLIPTTGGALMYRQSGKVQPVFWFGQNAYTLNANLLTDDDFGKISPFYVTYFFVTHDQEGALSYQDATGERQPLGSGRKLLAYLKAYVAGTGTITITPLLDNLSNPGVLVGVRTLTQLPKFDLEWGGGQAQADRIALKFASSPIVGTDNSFSLQRLTAFLKRAQRLQIRGAG